MGWRYGSQVQPLEAFYTWEMAGLKLTMTGQKWNRIPRECSNINQSILTVETDGEISDSTDSEHVLDARIQHSTRPISKFHLPYLPLWSKTSVSPGIHATTRACAGNHEIP